MFQVLDIKAHKQDMVLPHFWETHNVLKDIKKKLREKCDKKGFKALSHINPQTFFH